MIFTDESTKKLVPYVTGGITGDWADCLRAYRDNGADAIEIGLPFSDPMLDGPTIQEASDRALARGATLDSILTEVRAMRAEVPLIVMTYTNLAIRPGFCARLADAGIAGLIVPDAPLDEVTPIRDAANAAGLDLIPLVAPSTRPDRLRDIAVSAQGFVYAVSVLGTTGERDRLDAGAGPLAAAVRALTELPVLIGFGVSTPEHAAAAVRDADGVVVASALMRRLLDGASPAELGAMVARFRESTRSGTGVRAPESV
ncbi:tryptophan synthase alpha chain [Catenuloplanes nepalensis]|uniref:Tryptophan synthase alpha chain n=1 Tax=Catenuloplanes nepalensis TaxID=587533 RepID=A0ABT9N2E1_9ACTN|nr:tryptophan synthase subunit alpha [Catenuloplanes nepalensis]MDP9797745.1 tryptophan synthase alpha chain [Catenuloplanes nepalensis]